MSIFRRVVETGSFSAVARETRFSQPTVSKHIAALEERLGIRLLNRSTRQLNLTEAGREYYEHCVRVLDDLAEAEASVGRAKSQPTGTLRVSTPIAFGRLQILPHLWKFLAAYPDLKIDLLMDDHNVDLVKEGVDVVIRMGPMASSTLIAQKIGDCARVTVASPEYLATRGEPKKPADLKDHDCLVFTLLSTRNEWHFNGHKGVEKSYVNGRFSTNSPDAVREAVLAGMGIAVTPLWLIEGCVEQGRLKVILGDYKPTPMEVHAAYPDRRFVPGKVRYFIDHVRTTLDSSVTSVH
ncbi:DNA-binding transcriptional LysR family regulator [Thiogranum longum]|uniref:DNA-binding transcriptional LysR family regulator n=1 Tax=Thiogranum longum TaxID=1537524 RepID=A0A4R1HAP7_9GAMM|nr:LysR family transcriptional regulator [Thiogranum longum]TCK19027.1 DNA-binding transcriptional LysR family regulator [Thiogranum longum]